MLKRIVALLMLGMTVTLVGCNTMAGMGKDIERGGEKLEGEARETKRNM